MTQVDPPTSFVLFSPLPNHQDDEKREGRGCEDSGDYFRGRERAERAAAKRAWTTHARSIHQELALAYAAKSRDKT